MTDHSDEAPWPAVAPLVGELAESGPAERAARLAQLDAPIRSAVSRYLAALDTDAGWLDQPAAALLSEPSDSADPVDPEAETTVGPWRLVRLIGRGGMGAVYEAVRTEGGFTQRAAVKMVRADLIGGVVLDRFRRERELVARLRHRNIAALVDGGVTSTGRPWYAMELVDGEPITTWCDRRRLDPIGRIRLVRQACGAVHYAHRELIVHRDLKPGNILVSDDGTVKLLDFGIAKLLDPAADPGNDLTLGGWGGAPVTPNYASPEQLTGAPVSVSGDIYSLGVILYQLLAGVVPFPVVGDLGRHRARVQTELPRSLAAAAGGLRERLGWGERRARRWLRGDVERVVQMALRKEPDRRYPSADALGSDLERLTTGRPVVARPDGGFYRLRRLVGRNPIASASTAILTVGLLASSLAAVDRANRAEAARAAAAAAAARAENVTGFLTDLLGAPDPWVGDRDITVRQLLDQAAEKAGADFGADPAGEAAVRLALGRSYRGLGQWAPARREFERALAVAIGRGLGPERFGAERGLAEVLAEQGDPVAARRWYDSASATASTIGDSLGLATVAADLASLFGQIGEPDSAAAAAIRAVALRRRINAPPIELANALNNLAVSLLERGLVDSARSVIAEAVSLLRKAGPAGAPPLAAALATQGGLEGDLGDFAAADRSYRESLVLRRKIFGAGHPDEIGTLVNLGANALAAARYHDALAWADSVIARIGPEALPPDHPLVGAARTVRGRALTGLGRLPDAEGELRAALALRRAGLPPGHPALGYTLLALGEAISRQGRPAEARPFVAEAKAVLLAAFGPDHPRTKAAAEQLRRLD